MKSGDIDGIFYRHWELDSKKLFLGIPGLGCHSEYFLNIGDNCNLLGASVMAIDLPGFGKSGGARGDFANFSDITRAVDNAVDFAKKEIGVRDVYILGNSFGGLTAGIYATGENVKIDGMVICGAALTGMIMQALIKVLGDKDDEDKADITKVLPEPVLATPTMKAFIEDPLAVKAYTKRFVEGTIASRESMWQNAGKVTVPTLNLLGKDDKFVTVEEQEKFMNLIASDRKHFKILDNMDHSFGGLFLPSKIELGENHKEFFSSIADFVK